MVYLIDDKKYRQEHDYHWDDEKFKDFSNIIKPIYNLEELRKNRVQIFQKHNTVLYHESFLDNTASSINSQQKRIELEDYAHNNSEFNLAIFSGSKFSRNLVDNIAHLPVAVLYNNLASFLLNVIEGKNNLNYLLFGDSPLVEKSLNEKLNEALLKIGNENPAKIKDKNNLVLRPVKGFIQNPIEDAVEKVLFNKDLSDQKLSEYIDDYLDDRKYDNIFIPLCFGSILSDFNGLRLATHIRLTDNINQLSRIYIYGFAEIEYLLNHECFNILKTKNVKLIPYSRSAIEEAGNSTELEFARENFFEEIKKLKLDVPKDYEDNHSISNEWAISQWTYCIPKPIYNRVENVLNKVENRLYFKYLNTLRETQVIHTLKEQDLKINNANKEKILLIDNDYKKGWKEIFNYILIECNKIQMDTLEIDYRALSRNEIINSAYNKVIDPITQRINYSVVILDFRLDSSDNDEVNIDLISGMQILKKLKAFNPGIQVIIFSATNKIWNLQALQKAGADGFILKESPAISFDFDFTKQSILNMIDKTSECLSMIFLKDINNIIKRIKDHLNSVSNNSNEAGLDGLMKMKFKNEIFIQLDIVYDCLKKSSEDISTYIKDENSYLNLSFISIHKIVELINDYYTDDSGCKLKSNSIKVQKYDQNSKTFMKTGNEYPTVRDKIYSIIKFELNDDPSNYVINLNRFIKYRNNIIHPRTLKEYKKSSKEENTAFLNLTSDLITKIR